MAITLNLQGGPAHGKIVRVDWGSPTKHYKVPLAPKLTSIVDSGNVEEFLTVTEITYRPVLDTHSKPMTDKNGYYYYEP